MKCRFDAYHPCNKKLQKVLGILNKFSYICNVPNEEQNDIIKWYTQKKLG